MGPIEQRYVRGNVGKEVQRIRYAPHFTLSGTKHAAMRIVYEEGVDEVVGAQLPVGQSENFLLCRWRQPMSVLKICQIFLHNPEAAALGDCEQVVRKLTNEHGEAVFVFVFVSVVVIVVASLV